MRIWKRAWFWVLAAVLLFLGMLASLFLTDEGPPADQDLRDYRRRIAVADNGFQVLNLDSNAVEVPDEADMQWKLLSGSEPFDKDAARALVAKHEELLRRIPECLSLADLQVPALGSYTDSRGYLSAWRVLALVLLHRAWLHAEEDRIKESLVDGLLLVRFGHRIEGAQGDVITARIGQTIRGFGATAIINATRRGVLPLTEIGPFLAELRRHERNLEGFKDSLRGDYCVAASLVDAVAAGTITGDAKNFVPTGFLARLLLKANQTKRLLAEETRSVLAEVERSQSGARELIQSSPVMSSSQGVGNHPGKAMVPLLLGRLRRDLGVGKHLLFYVRAAQVFLALKTFQTTTGNLPDSLAALVPEYLPAVPEDPFDGQPLRYDAAKRIVYSVGSDLFDAHGSAAETPSEALDDPEEPTLRL